MAPRAPALSAAQRRTHLTTAAQRVLRAKGSAATTRDIAEEAGVAEGTIFRVFQTKEDLVNEAVIVACDPAPLLARLQRIDPAEPLRDRLVEAAGAMQQRFIEVFGLLQAVGMVQPPPAASRGHRDRPARATHHDVLAALQELVEPDRAQLRVSPAELVRLLRLLTFSGSHVDIADGKLLTPEQIVDTILDGTRRGQRPGEPAAGPGTARHTSLEASC